MPPVLLSRSEIDSLCWDQFIQHSQQSVIYGYSWYLDIVCEDWNALVWPSREDFQVVMPLPIRKKLGFRILYQPLFCQYLGIFSKAELTVQVVCQFLNSCCDTFKYISSYNFHPSNFDLLRLCEPTLRSVLFQTKHTYWLSIDQPFAETQFGYSLDRKQNIRRGKQFGWIIEQSKDMEPMINLFQIYHEIKIGGGVNPETYKLLEKLTRKLLEQHCVKIFYATKCDTIHAGVMLVGDDKMAIYLFNAADEVGRKQNARSVLLDHYFEKTTCDILDFESPEVEAISNFYKSFGAQKRPYFCLSKNGLPFPLREIQKLRKRWLLKTS